jgi:hypothetical protein
MRVRRRQWVLDLALLAVVLAVGFFVWWPPDPPRPVTALQRDAAERIKEGMTLAEVIGILGPPGDYRTMETRPAFELGVTRIGPEDPDFLYISTVDWRTDTADVIVVFDSAGRTRSGSYIPNKPSLVSPPERFLRWLERLRRRWFP